MRLVIISNMAHYRRADGVIVGHGATARELDALSTLFTEVRHVACLHDEPAPASALPYMAQNITLVPVPPAGGDTLSAKLGIVRHTPLYLRTIARELRRADAVHVRCPANISLYALAMLSGMRAPRRRWIKYAGNWQAVPGEPVFYGVQRRWLARPGHRAQVSVNGRWPDQPAYVHTLANPSMTRDELVRGRIAAVRKQLTSPVRLLFVGHLGAAKGPRIAIDAVALLRQQNIEVTLDLAGDGADLAAMRDEVAARGLAGHVRFHGALARPALDELYVIAHAVVLPSRTEGWPKVLGEGMATGAVPIATAVGSIPEILAEYRVGHALAAPASAEEIARVVRDYLTSPRRWREESERCTAASAAFGYDTYLAAVARMLDL